MEWVIECRTCRRPFVIEAADMPVEGREYLRVPLHEIPDISRSRCMGCDESGLFIGAKGDYKPRRRTRDLLRKHPEYAP